MNNYYRSQLLKKFESKFQHDKFLTRQTVSFQANKTTPIYRWFKYKEGFSANLVQYYIEKFNLQNTRVLDPFAGVGTSLFASTEYGCHATGIEILPVGAYIIQQKAKIDKINPTKLQKEISKIWKELENFEDNFQHIKHIPITEGAFSETTQNLLNKYITHTNNLDNDIQSALQFIAFTVLEDVSYTRKDGQYLRWDYRANRKLRQRFDKGKIIEFKQAINTKLNEIIVDLSPNPEYSLFPQKMPKYSKGKVSIIEGSCLYELPKLADNSFDLIITSPPYANRYDYTRTYALELVFLGCDNDKVKQLRQQMLSCTVENKSKIQELQTSYEKRNKITDYQTVLNVYKNNQALTEIISILEAYKEEKKLNNNGVLSLVKNYFLEMCFSIYEMARLLDKGGRIVMVNDNVKYAGEEVPVDLILSDFAEKFGLSVESIFVLSQQKGNSSQQMGTHGRTPLRKCVYLWQKN